MSGGTTSVINATLAGVIAAAQKSKKIDKIYAGAPGIVGFMGDCLIDLTRTSKAELAVLKQSPGSASVGTTRAKILNDRDMARLRECFDKYGIGYFVNIGGNGTIEQTKAIASNIKSVQLAAAPKTVDNDLGDDGFRELWFTPGFPSCVNYWYHKMHMLDNENRGASTHDRVLIAQTFGRETGFIVGSMRLFDTERKLPLVLLLPEDQQAPEKVLSKIEDNLSKFGRSLVGICEGYTVRSYDHSYDFSGQKMYGSSSSSAVQQLINLCTENGIKARGFNPTVDQRQNFDHTLESDVRVSYDIGEEIVKNFMKGETHFFQAYSRDGLHIVPLEKIGNYSRTLKEEWIQRGCFDVTDEYVSYLTELAPTMRRRSLYTFGSVV